MIVHVLKVHNEVFFFPTFSQGIVWGCGFGRNWNPNALLWNQCYQVPLNITPKWIAHWKPALTGKSTDSAKIKLTLERKTTLIMRKYMYLCSICMGVTTKKYLYVRFASGNRITFLFNLYCSLDTHTQVQQIELLFTANFKPMGNCLTFCSGKLTCTCTHLNPAKGRATKEPTMYVRTLYIHVLTSR